MRTMYDGITPDRLPAGGQLYASYVDGRWPNYHQLRHLFPHAVLVSICVDPTHNAQVLDVERFDATPEQAPGWAARQRGRGQVPTVYSNTSTWPAIKAAFHAQHVPLPEWWAANYDDGPDLPVEAVAVQYRSTPGYDQSVVRDYWPGVDPAPPPPHPKPKPDPEPKPPKPVHVVRPGDTMTSIAAGWHVSLAELEKANPHAGHPPGDFDVIWPGDVIRHP